MPPRDHQPTRQTLIVRLSDRADHDSWAEFAEIYTPMLYAYCQRRELKHADIADIVQEVMRSVSLALGKHQYDPQKGKFRAWLFTCVRNAISSHLRKRSRHPLSAGETAVLDAISATPSKTEEQMWEVDYQRRLVSWALEKIEPEFAPRIWRAFELTAIDGRSADEAAAEVGMSKNALGVAKHRVLARLREKVHSTDPESWEREMIDKDSR